MKFPKAKKNRGFTLVELLVAVGVFLVVMTISLGSVISIIESGRKAKTLKAVMTNLNFTLEVMSREIKFGTDYHCGITSSNPPSPQNCTGQSVPPDDAITFLTSNDTHTIYRLNGSQIEKSVDGGSTYVGVTSPEITIEDLKFYVFGTGTDGLQPRVLILIRGYAGGQRASGSRFTLQSMVSQRVRDS